MHQLPTMHQHQNALAFSPRAAGYFRKNDGLAAARRELQNRSSAPRGIGLTKRVDGFELIGPQLQGLRRAGQIGIRLRCAAFQTTDPGRGGTRDRDFQ